MIERPDEFRRARAAVFVSPCTVEIQEREIVRSGDAVFVESHLMGISHGTESVIYSGDFPRGVAADASIDSLAFPMDYPLAYGYMNVGLTEHGDRVFGFFPHQDRFYAQPSDIVDIGALDYRDAIFCASMETALCIVQDARAVAGDVALVVGLGTVGLLVTAILRKLGVFAVAATDRHSLRLEAAKAMGANVFASETSDGDAVASFTAGRGFDVAIHLSGTSSGLQRAVDCAAYSGTVVEASWYGTRRVRIALGDAFHRKRLRLVSSQVSTIAPELTGRWDKRRRMELALDLIREIRPSRLITHTMKLEAVADAFALIHDHPDRCIQVVLEP